MHIVKFIKGSFFMIQELKVQELAQISGGDFSIYGEGRIGRGYSGGEFGLSYRPEGSGYDFFVKHNVTHVNGVGTFSEPSIGINFGYSW